MNIGWEPPLQGVVAVVRRYRALLVIRRSQTVRAPGAYCFPGGGIEDDEDEPAALRREMHEELGVVVQPVRRIWECRSPSGRVQLFWWLTELAPAAHPLPNPAEVESVHWLEPDHILSLPGLLETNRAFLTNLASGHIDLTRSTTGS